MIFTSLFLFLSFFKNGVFRNSGKEKSPIHKTLQDLKNLEKKKYAEKGNYRMFYVELIDITRAFLVKQYHIPADVLLTDDLIDVMKHTNKISPENELEFSINGAETIKTIPYEITVYNPVNA